MNLIYKLLTKQSELSIFQIIFNLLEVPWKCEFTVLTRHQS